MKIFNNVDNVFAVNVRYLIILKQNVLTVVKTSTLPFLHTFMLNRNYFGIGFVYTALFFI